MNTVNILKLKRFVTYLCVILIFFGLTACSENQEKQTSVDKTVTRPSPAATQSGRNIKTFRSISPSEAYQMLQDRKGMIFLDVRTQREREQGFIAGSQLVALGALLRGSIALPKDKPILLVCAVGGRSYAAGRILSSRGHSEVYNLSGGISAWLKAGFPLSSGAAKK